MFDARDSSEPDDRSTSPDPMIAETTGNPGRLTRDDSSTSQANDSRPRGSRPVGLRIALWYATLFIIGAMAIVVLTYLLTRASLEQRDRQIINAKLGEYANVYARGGVSALADTVAAEQRTAPERLFVRVAGDGSQALVLSSPGAWNPSSLEVASARLDDGVLMQVGKSTE